MQTARTTFRQPIWRQAYSRLAIALACLSGCAFLRHDYHDVAQHATEFIRMVRNIPDAAADPGTYYREYLAPYAVRWDTAAHARIDSLLGVPARNSELVITELRAAVRSGIMKNMEAMPGCRVRDTHTDLFWRMKYLYGVLRPMIRDVSAWSGRDDLDAECTFQLERLELFPFSVSSVKAANAFQDALDRAFLLFLYRDLDAVAKSTGNERSAAWQHCRTGCRALRPRIENMRYRERLDALFSAEPDDTGISVIRTTLSRALPRAVEKVDVQFNVGG